MSAISAGTIFLVPSSTPTLSAAGFAGDSSVLSATWIVAPTSTASAFDDGSSSASFSPSASPEYLIANAVDMLNTALGALVIGLVLASVTFGVVGTKALTYFRGRNGDSGLVKTALAGLLLLNEIQLIATIRAVYTAVVVDFGRFSGLVDNEWSTMIQTFLVTLTAAVAQVFFALRLHAIKRNALLTLTIVRAINLAGAASRK
ncbi:hypothetical protein C8Q76DRAFT_474106 [Earliella scabrosa]|nr:hypothetical protein C8Q76DRAFT_474106 [Earliella scabrosa]